MAHASTVSALPRSASPMPKHSGLRPMTPSRVNTRSSQGAETTSRSLVRGRSEYQRGQARASTMAVASPSTEVDCFSALGLTPSASAAEIRQAYRSLAKKYHPDANPVDEASTKFVELRSAYESCLLKESTRASAAESSPVVGRKTRRSTTTAAASAMTSSPTRLSRRNTRRDAWDDIWDEMLASPKTSRRRR